MPRERLVALTRTEFWLLSFLFCSGHTIKGDVSALGRIMENIFVLSN